MAKNKQTAVVAAVAAVASSEDCRTSIIERIDALILKDASVDTETHAVAIIALRHAAPEEMGGFGDITLIARLLGDVSTKGGKTFGKGVRSRRKALIEWLGSFSPIRVNGDGLIGMLKEGAKNYVPFNIDGAETMPFFDMPTEKARRASNNPFDVATMHGRIMSFGKAIDKAVENDNLNGDEAALRELANRVQTAFTTAARELGLDVQAAKDARQAA